MRNIVYEPTSPDFVIKPTGRFIVSTDCYTCGNKTRVSIDKDADFDRSESEYWEERYKDLMGTVNSLISDTENRTGYNPAKEVFIKKLTAIRDRFGR